MVLPIAVLLLSSIKNMTTLFYTFKSSCKVIADAIISPYSGQLAKDNMSRAIFIELEKADLIDISLEKYAFIIDT